MKYDDNIDYTGCRDESESGVCACASVKQLLCAICAELHSGAESVVEE